MGSWIYSWWTLNAKQTALQAWLKQGIQYSLFCVNNNTDFGTNNCCIASFFCSWIMDGVSLFSWKDVFSWFRWIHRVTTCAYQWFNAYLSWYQEKSESIPEPKTVPTCSENAETMIGSGNWKEDRMLLKVSKNDLTLLLNIDTNVLFRKINKLCTLHVKS